MSTVDGDRDDLDVPDLIAKLGSMSNTTKCCATGTCVTVGPFGDDGASDADLPRIEETRDNLHPVDLVSRHGALSPH